MIELARTQAFHGVRFDGRTYDCGSKLGFLSANLAFALDRSDIAPGLKEELRRLGFAGEGRLTSVRCQAERGIFQPRLRMIKSGL